MCYGCWKEAGFPTDTAPATDRVMELVRDLYSYESVGGPLHVVVDDWNLEDEHLKAYYEGDEIPEVRAICDELVSLLRSMTLPQRYAAMARHDGFIPVA